MTDPFAAIATAGIRVAGIHRFPAGWSWSFLDHPLPWTGSLLGSVLDGAMRIFDLRQPARRHPAPAGTVYWLPLPRLAFQLENAADRPLTVAWFRLDAAMPEAEAPLLRTVPDPLFWAELAHRAAESVRRREAAAGRCWLAAMAQELVAGGPASPAVVDETRRSHAAAITALARQVQLQPGRGWRSAGMARAVGLSGPQFTRVFRAQMGVPPRIFVEQARIAAVRTLLLSTSHPLQRIAELTGFPDQFALSRAFRRIEGRPPSAFRAGR